MYRARKNLKGPKIVLEITARRASLLSKANARVETMEDVKYAFADITCRLGLKMSDGSLQFFSNEMELKIPLE